MVHRPNEAPSRKRRKIVIGGVPGIGKTTLALSASGVFVFDIDGGWDRVNVYHRKAVGYSQVQNYEELLTDLGSAIIAEAETLVIDTGGALLNLMKPWAIKQNPINWQKDGVTLSMRGYGVVGQEFERFCSYVCYGLQKNLIVLFHAKEEMDGDQKIYRLDIEGQSRANVWKAADLGGFMEAIRDKRVIGFSPTDRYFAKGTHGISGVIEVPDLAKGVANDFLTTLFAKVEANIDAEAAVMAEYDALMIQIRNLVEEVKTAGDANDIMEKFSTFKYVFASRAEAWHLLKERAQAVGLKYDGEAKRFVVDPEAIKAADKEEAKKADAVSTKKVEKVAPTKTEDAKQGSLKI